MITAEEARELTQKQILNTVEEYINKAILDGKFGIDCSGTLSLEAQKQLTSLGYKVRNGLCDRKPFYQVTWEVD